MTMIQHRDCGDESEAAMTDERAAVEHSQIAPCDVDDELDALRAENTELSARVSELTRLLAEAEEALRNTRSSVRGAIAWRIVPNAKRRNYIGDEEIQSMLLVLDQPAVQRALHSIEGGG